ncbi:MAG: hypothetical protein M1814_006593 [Vezdaea aestivalis]|nr:MAG: hypothetical protein M1814_006593 [Vezdaea aestivalis]
MSIRTGTELITLTVLINKISGFYGLLAILTGLHLSPLQTSMYIYSCAALVLTAFLAPHIRKQSPLQCLALAWLYIIDSFINAAYTTAFGITWFLVVSQHHSTDPGGAPGPGGKTIEDTAGFTSPVYNVSRVEVGVGKTETGQIAGVAAGIPGGPAKSATSPSLGHGVLQPESIPSLVVIIGLWAVRVYFVLVVMAYARSVLRMHVYSASTTRLETDLASDAGASENPFAKETREGQGWKGKLGRMMVGVGTTYWLGSQEDNSWMRAMGQKFRSGNNQTVEGGPQERERRRRSGTGPPAPPKSMLRNQSPR